VGIEELCREIMGQQTARADIFSLHFLHPARSISNIIDCHPCPSRQHAFLFERWDEARKNWGMNINHTRNLVRLGNAMYDQTGVSAEKRAEDLKVLALCTWAFVRAMKRHLSPADEDEEAFVKELYEKLPERQAAAIIAAAHRPNRALQDLSTAIENLPMHFMRKNEIHKAATIFEDNLGSSERLLTSPVPLFYSRHTARFLSFWLLLLPFALFEPFGASWNHIAMIPATAVISIFLFGIEELATQVRFFLLFVLSCNSSTYRAHAVSCYFC
jgi:ion channel-forming bestrophin family protein